ncbi:MAG: Adaptive-response sensory-kinase SasA [Phycisphaerae bacterium]|nr:Adaptive-response sensory-kinase SasA [Phycisphaerae bacterium]
MTLPAQAAPPRPPPSAEVISDVAECAVLPRETETCALRPTVVVIDDDAGDVEILRRNLDRIPAFHYALVHCPTAARGRAALAGSSSSVVFLDYRLGADDGVAALRGLRAAPFLGPIIAITGQGDEYAVADLMRAGADDYVAKGDITPDLLQRAIRNAASQHARRCTEAHNRQLLAELSAAKRSLERKNARLTELYNTAHQFVDNVSHEFRTPLTVIKEFTAIVRDGLAGEVGGEAREYLEIVLNRTDDLSTMVDDMLDISKLEAGVLGIWRRVCPVRQIVEHVRTTLERKATAARAGLSIQLADDLPDAYCDPEKIGRVIINLTVNALKAVQQGGHVVLAVERAAAPDPWICFGVSDDGPGIAREHLEAIFVRFRQLDGPARSSTKGFGLGLSIARELVHLNFGEISVESELGRGSTFSFTVPSADPAAVLSTYLRRVRCESVSLLTARAGGDANPPAAALLDVEEFLQRQLRSYDLLFPAGGNRWLITAAVGATELPSMLARLERNRAEANRNRPVQALPAIAFVTHGTWCPQTQQAELTRRFLAELDRAKSAGASGADPTPKPGPRESRRNSRPKAGEAACGC